MLLQGVDIQHVAQRHVNPCYLVGKSDNFLWCNMDFSSRNIFVYFPFFVLHMRKSLEYYININYRKNCNFASCKEIVISQSFENLQFNYQQMVIRRNTIIDGKSQFVI